MKTIEKIRWTCTIIMLIGLIISGITFKYYSDARIEQSLYILSLFFIFMAIGGGVVADYIDDSIISRLHRAFYIHACILQDCTYLTKKEHMEDLDKTGKIIYEIFDEIRDLSENERDSSWDMMDRIHKYSRNQQICSQHYFDWDTGLCKDNVLKGEHKCSKYPLCPRKVSHPIMRSDKKEIE